MKQVQKEVRYRVTKPCSSCGGSGREVCHRCGGRGIIYVPIYGCDQQCPNCGGSGLTSCFTCCGSGKQESYESRWETEWVDEPVKPDPGSYVPHVSASSYTSSRRGRRSGGLGRYVAAGIIGVLLGDATGHMWLCVFLAFLIAYCGKKKR